ncbi:hypothetical protein [Candidatus Uabimicrobium amorphum]|nr:hypothetical protein [Candidatus Uabimicrobium amorphum]
MNGIVIAVLPIAMILEEKLVIKGKLSPRLLFGLREYQRVFHSILKDKINFIDIEPNALKPDLPYVKNSSAISLFSGGVDSFYTLYHHNRQNEKVSDYQISHLLFAHGLDIKLEEQTIFERVFENYNDLANRLDVHLVKMKCNFRRYIPDYSMFHAPCFLALAQCISKNFSCIYIPSTLSYRNPAIWGSTIYTDHCFSTEKTFVFHNGANKDRTQKIEQLIFWKETYSHLRVCFSPNIEKNNCGKCEKCLRTMIPLNNLGMLNRYSVFPQKILWSLITMIFFSRKTISPHFYHTTMIQCLRRGKILYLFLLCCFWCKCYLYKRFIPSHKNIYDLVK